MSLIDVRDVRVDFPQGATTRHALADIDVSFDAGTITLLEGPSGSGKTTLLSVLGGLLRPHAGVVRIGTDVLDHSDARALSRWRLRGVGFVFQAFRLFQHLSVLDNVALPLRLAGSKRRESDASARRALAQVGMSAHASQPPSLLSGGEQQRVAVARALVASPPVILADEPTAALDADNGRDVAELLRAAAHGGAAVIVASHDERLHPYADRRVRLVDGRLAAWLVAVAAALSGACSSSAVAPRPDVDVRVSAEGRVEGASETHRLGFARDGLIATVHVQEGDRVHAGQLMARLDCRDLSARHGAALAQVAVADARRLDLLAGGRADERAEAAAMLAAAEASVVRADSDFTRSVSLFDDGILPKSELDVALEAKTVAMRMRDAARERMSRAAGVPAADDVRVADAAVSAARQDAGVLSAQLSQCELRAPIDGIVIQAEARAGESWTSLLLMPAFEVADLSELRVRVEVADADIPRVSIGQAVELRAESGGPVRVGTVVRLVPRYGHREVRRRAVGDLADADVREVLVAISGRSEWLPGQRVTAVFLASDR